MAIEFRGRRQRALTRNNDNVASTSIVFLYRFTDFESGVEISTQPDIPLIGAVHPDDPSLICNNINTGDPNTTDQKSGTYGVVASFSNNIDEFSIGSQTTRPWKLPPYNLSFPPFTLNVPIERTYQSGDANGFPTRPYVNSANDLIADTRVEYGKTVKFSFNLKTVREGWIDEFIGTINDRDIMVVGKTIPALKGLLRQFQATPKKTFDTEGELLFTYEQIDVEIDVRKRQWDKQPADIGFNFLVDDGGIKKFRIYTDNRGNFGRKTVLQALPGAIEEDIIPFDEALKLDGLGALRDQALEGVTFLGPFFDKFPHSWDALSFPKTTDG